MSELKRRSGKRGEATPLRDVFGLEARPSLSTPVCHFQPPVHLYKLDIFLTCTSAHVFDTLGIPLSSLQIPTPWCLSKLLLPKEFETVLRMLCTKMSNKCRCCHCHYSAIIDIVTHQWWLGRGVGGDWNSLQSNQTCCLIARQLWLEVVITAMMRTPLLLNGEDDDDNDDGGDGLLQKPTIFAKSNF